MSKLPAIEPDCFDDAIASKLSSNSESMARILVQYSSLCQRYYSGFAAEDIG